MYARVVQKKIHMAKIFQSYPLLHFPEWNFTLKRESVYSTRSDFSFTQSEYFLTQGWKMNLMCSLPSREYIHFNRVNTRSCGARIHFKLEWNIYFYDFGWQCFLYHSKWKYCRFLLSFWVGLMKNCLVTCFRSKNRCAKLLRFFFFFNKNWCWLCVNFNGASIVQHRKLTFNSL